MMPTIECPILFNVEHVTRAGVTLVAPGLSRAEAELHLDLARIERVSGRCTRVVLAVRDKPAPEYLPARASWRTRAVRTVPLTDKQHAAVMAEMETV